MSDPVEDAITGYHSIQEAAFEDFDAWCRAQDDAGSEDIEALAQRYADDCASGAWEMFAWQDPITPSRPHPMKETG